MKVIKLSAIILTVALFLFACSKDNAVNIENNVLASDDSLEEYERINLHGNYVEYDEEDSLYKEAELIVLAHTNKDFLDREHIITMTPADGDLPETIEDFYTKTPIIITEVIKSPEGSNIKANDEIEIIEPISILEEEKKILLMENYTAINKDDKYIIYLQDNSFGEYSIINLNNGRFNLESDEQIVNLHEHGHDNDKEKHAKFKKQVKEKFKVELKKYNF
ncbi:hypothetical protein [Halalkalibacterium halodurans]|uniref:hypothetical protein n=1 Tax=Halalkalibacterium halodurans TaxID=86665 RepID=UPI002AAA3ABB|nr:hypothetical protein [Halalkalibacterium halodurans]MDY7224238.1 hypothetical protein [Halalkalibacterium halodurans]MDY7243523.1 hypothetical protein [Halalkalibacterium halodurans]